MVQINAGNLGFMEEGLKSISERVKATDYPLISITLIFYKMSIRQHIKHIKYGSEKYSDYVDFGNKIINDSTSITKDTLVFLFIYMNPAWKMSIGYFFINGITADQKSNLIIQCIFLLHNTGVRVVALTFDSAATN